MADQSAGGFFYTLNIQSNIAQVNKELGSFIKGTGKIAGVLTAITASAKLVANQYRELNSVSILSRENLGYVKQIENEFRLLGQSAEDGSSLVQNLAGQIKELQTFGTGKLPELARLGINLSDIQTAEQYIQALRKSASEDINTFVSVAPALGIDRNNIQFFTQTEEAFRANRELAMTSSVALTQTVQSQQEFNREFGKLTIGFDKLTRALIPIGTNILRGANALAEDPKEAGKTFADSWFSNTVKTGKAWGNVFGTIGGRIANSYRGSVAEQQRFDALSPEEKTALRNKEKLNLQDKLYNSSFGNWYRDNISSYGMGSMQNGTNSVSNTTNSTNNVTNNKNTINVNVSSPQEVSELKVYNEAFGR